MAETRAREGQIRLTDGRALSYAQYGAAKGPVIVVLDGAGSRTQARYAGMVAQDLGLVIVAPDRPGFFGSTPNPCSTPRSCAGDVAALIDALAIETAGVLAQSLGAPFALALVHEHPERVHHLGLVGPIGPFDRSGARDGMDRPTRLIFTLARRAPLVLQGLFTLLRRQAERDPERAAERFARLRPVADQAVMRREDLWPLLVEHFPELWASPDAARREFTSVVKPWGFDVADIAVPTTIWAAGADTVHPLAMARDLAERIPMAQLVIEPDGGVFSFIDRYPEILRAVAPPNGAASS